jgi:aquaporin Z
MTKKLLAEFIGTFTLVAAVCGSALFSAPSAGLVAVAFAVGLSVVTMAYAVGAISGGHFNPAVTLGLWAAGRVPTDHVVPYVLTQCVGGAVAAGIFALILAGAPAAPQGHWNTFQAVSNTYGGNGFSMSAVFLTEFVITALFLIVIMGATVRNFPVGFAPLAIGLALTMFHLMAIPVDNASLNPARSLATAIYASSGALTQVWLFFVAPILGGMAGGVIARWLLEEKAPYFSGALDQVSRPRR